MHFAKISSSKCFLGNFSKISKLSFPQPSVSEYPPSLFFESLCYYQLLSTPCWMLRFYFDGELQKSSTWVSKRIIHSAFAWCLWSHYNITDRGLIEFFCLFVCQVFNGHFSSLKNKTKSNLKNKPVWYCYLVLHTCNILLFSNPLVSMLAQITE